MTPSPESAHGAGRPLGVALAMTAIVLIAINLRPGASSVGPVLEEIRADLSMSGGTAGVMTALPGLLFGLVGGVAVWLARRFGVTGTIILGLVAVVVGLLARVAVDGQVLFLALTALALGGMAIGNVLVPAWIKSHARDGGVRGMTVYSTVLIAGGSIAAATTAPISGAHHLGWRAALGVWGLIAVVALVPWAIVALRGRGADRVAQEASTSTGSMWRSPTVLSLTLLFGIQSMNAYVQFGWLPQIYRDAGLSAEVAGVLASLVAALGIIGGLIMSTVIARSPTLAPWMVAFGVLMVVGYLGLLLAPATVPWLWSVCLGVSGFAFPTAIALITARTRNPHVTARVSGFVQPVGYALAAVGPFAVGLIYDVAGGWTVVLVLLMVSGLVMTWAGLRVSRPSLVDDELRV